MWLPPFDTKPTAREKEKFLNSYWVRQLNQYRRLIDEAKDTFVIERTGAYPLWHFEIGKRDNKHKLILTDSMPVELSETDIGRNVIRVSSDEDPSFKSTINSIKHGTHGLQRQIDIIKGDVDIDGRINNPKHYSGDPNIHARRTSNKEK